MCSEFPYAKQCVYVVSFHLQSSVCVCSEFLYMYVCLQSLESESESDGDEVGDVHVDPSTSSYCNENILHQCCSSKATCIHLGKKLNIV